MAGSPSRSIPRTTPARKNKAATSRKATKPSLLGRVIAHPGIIVAGATFAAVMTGIVVNAVMFQKGHHPSPLFATPPAQTASAEPERVAPPTPVPVPIPREVPETPARPAPLAESPAPSPAVPMMLHPARPVVKTALHTVAPPHKAAATAKPHHDLIGQLLGKTSKGE